MNIINNQNLNIENQYDLPFLNKIDVKKYTNKILSYSLMWFGMAISFILIFSFSILKIEFLQEKYLSLFRWSRAVSKTQIIVFVLAFVINIALYFFIIFAAKNKSIPIFVFALSYILFVILETFWLPLLLLELDNTTVILVFLVPTCSISLMGILGYFRIVNFEKWLPFIAIAIFISFIVFIMSYFMTSNFLNGIYSFLGVFISLVISGYTFYQMKTQTSEILNYFRGDEKEIKNFMIREGLVNGLILFVSFIRILIEVLRFVKK